MATLAVRPLSPLDLPALRQVRQRVDPLDLLADSAFMPPGITDQLASFTPFDSRREKVYVALIDGELCGYIRLRPRPGRFRWNVIALAAGSPRLDANDRACVELWTALLEYAIRRAGESGAKRLFATAADDGPALASLRGAGFEAYSRSTLLVKPQVTRGSERPPGLRRQEASDVWSIHQLYHHTTPRSVQFAEALTSSEWDLPARHFWSRAVNRRTGRDAWVLETIRGIEGYCEIERRDSAPSARLMIVPECRHQAASLVLSAAESSLPQGAALRLVIPEHAGELIGALEDAGFRVETERIALVRHTTVAATVHSRVAAIHTMEAPERVPKGIPSYYRACGGDPRPPRSFEHLAERSVGAIDNPLA